VKQRLGAKKEARIARMLGVDPSRVVAWHRGSRPVGWFEVQVRMEGSAWTICWVSLRENKVEGWEGES